MTGRKAVARFHNQAKTIRTGSLYDCFKDEVNRQGTGKVDGCKAAYVGTGCERGNYDQHDDNRNRTCKTRKALHNPGKPRCAQMYHYKAVCKSIKTYDIAGGDVNEQEYENGSGKDKNSNRKTRTELG